MPIRPTLIAAPNAAKPTCKFPVIYLTSGCAHLQSQAEINYFLSVRGYLSFRLMLANQHGKNGGEQHEHQGLNNSHDQLEKVKRNRYQPSEPRDKLGHCFQQIFPGENVA